MQATLRATKWLPPEEVPGINDQSRVEQELFIKVRGKQKTLNEIIQFLEEAGYIID